MSQADMNCERLEPLLSAYLDQQAGPEQAALVEDHLRHCEGCREALAEMSAWDLELREELAPTDVDRAVAKVEQALRQQTGVAPASGASAWSRWSMAAACAAAAMLVVILSWPPQSPPPAPAVAARLVAATGEVQYQSPAGRWQVVRVSRPVPLVVGSRLRTPDQSLCEIETPGSGTLRLNDDSELIVHDGDHVELVQGQMWCRAPVEGQLKVAVPTKADTAAPDSWSMQSSPADEFQWSVSADASQLEVMTEKPAKLVCGVRTFTCPSTPGTKVEVKSDSDPAPLRGDSQLPLIWQLPLLHDRSSVRDELHEMLESTLSRIGQTKASYMYEDQIRALGPAGAAPLLAYVRSSRSQQSPATRLRAMRIGSEMADASLRQQLSELATDADEQVQGYAEKALDRLR